MSAKMHTHQNLKKKRENLLSINVYLFIKYAVFPFARTLLNSQL